MNSREAEENGESWNRRRRENESSRDDGSERVPGGEESALADFVAERAGGICGAGVNEVVKRVECDRNCGRGADSG